MVHCGGDGLDCITEFFHLHTGDVGRWSKWG
jgi:hypothetical protein